MWWSGFRSFYEAIPTLHWRREGLLTEGVLRTVCFVLFLLTLCTRRRAGCTLLCNLRSMSVLTEVGISWVWSRGSSSHDQRFLVALSHSRPDLPWVRLDQIWILDLPVLLTTWSPCSDHLSRLKTLPLYACRVRSRANLNEYPCP